MIQGESQQEFASPEEALKHHGVKGMRWGVRNEDEPVGRDSSNRVTVGSQKPALSERKQRKVDKFLKNSDVMGTKISEITLSNEELKGTRNPVKLYGRHINNQSIKSLEKQQARAVKDAEAVKNHKLTSKQKKVIIGAVAVTAVLGYVAVTQGQQSGALNSYKLLAQARLRGQKVPFNVNKELRGSMSASDLLTKIAKPVNPLYSTPGGQMNCRRSTFTYELRRRGFDVRATTSAVGWGQSESGVINAVTTDGKDFFKRMSMSQAVVNTGASSVARGDARINPVKKILLGDLDASKPLGQYTGYISNSKRVLEELAKQPDGSRGEVVFKFPQFGHSMAWEVVDGVPHIFDSQKGTLYNSATKMVESKWDGFTAAEIMRLDNVDLDVNFLTRWATNAGGK